MNEYNNHSRTSTLMFNMNNMEMRIEIYRKRIPNCVSKRFRDESNSCFIIVFVVYALFFCRIFFWIGFIYTVIFVGCLLFYVLTDCNRCLRIWSTANSSVLPFTCSLVRSRISIKHSTSKEFFFILVFIVVILHLWWDWDARELCKINKAPI